MSSVAFKMFSPPHQFRFLVFTVLVFRVISIPFQIKDIIEKTSKGREISTIAFFGRDLDLESVLTDAGVDSFPQMVFTESYGNLYFGSTFNRNILIVACINLSQRSMLNRIDIAFYGIHAASRSIYLVPGNRYTNLRYLTEHFEWCWAKGFVNVLVIFTSTNETFTYTRFPEMRIFPWNLEEEPLFPDKYNDLMGYAIRTPLQFDPPRVFQYLDSYGRNHLTGYCAELFLAFLKKHNATMQVVNVNNSTEYDIPAIVRLIRKGLADISIHTYLGLEGVRSSYPVRMVQRCVLVPFRGEIQAYWYFIRPFQYYVWLGCLGTLIVISVFVAMEDYFRGLKYDFGRSSCEVFRLMLSLPISDSRSFGYRRAFRRVLIFVLGFMLTNLYLAYLTSFLAKVIFKPQIETLMDLVTNNISILTRDFEIPLVLQNEGLPIGFDRLLVSTSVTGIIPLTNQSMAYTTTDDKALFELTQQVHLRQPLYKIVDECVSTIPIGFLMAKHSPFEVILNRFILRVNQAGLLYKWCNDIFLNGLKAGILKILPSNVDQELPLTMVHFQFAWIALGGGLSLATLCFMFENITRVMRRFKVVVVYH